MNNKIITSKFVDQMYCFHIEKDDGMEITSGLGLYLRDKNSKFREFNLEYNRSITNLVNLLEAHEYNQIYTANPKNSPLLNNFNYNNKNDLDEIIIRYELIDYEIEEFEKKGIKVITLDRLI